MKKITGFLTIILFAGILSCKKESAPDPKPDPVPDSTLVKKDPREQYTGKYNVEIYDYRSERKYDTTIGAYKWIVVSDTTYRDVLTISFRKEDTISYLGAVGLGVSGVHSVENEYWGLVDSIARLFHVGLRITSGAGGFIGSDSINFSYNDNDYMSLSWNMRRSFKGRKQ